MGLWCHSVPSWMPLPCHAAMCIDMACPMAGWHGLSLWAAPHCPLQMMALYMHGVRMVMVSVTYQLICRVSICTVYDRTVWGVGCIPFIKGSPGCQSGPTKTPYWVALNSLECCPVTAGTQPVVQNEGSSIWHSLSLLHHRTQHTIPKHHPATPFSVHGYLRCVFVRFV